LSSLLPSQGNIKRKLQPLSRNFSGGRSFHIPWFEVWRALREQSSGVSGSDTRPTVFRSTLTYRHAGCRKMSYLAITLRAASRFNWGFRYVYPAILRPPFIEGCGEATMTLAHVCGCHTPFFGSAGVAIICASVNLLWRIVCLRCGRHSILLRDQMGRRSPCPQTQFTCPRHSSKCMRVDE